MGVGDGSLNNNGIVSIKKSIYSKEDPNLRASINEIKESGLFQEKLNPNKKFMNALLGSCYSIGKEVCHVHNNNMTDDVYNKMCHDIINACGGEEKMQIHGLNTSNKENIEAMKYRH